MTRKTIITILHLDNNQLSVSLEGDVSMPNVVIGMAKLIERVASGKVEFKQKSIAADIKAESFDERLKK